MRIPEAPPSKIPSESVDKVYSLLDSSAVRNHYLHWNELRRRKPPEGFSIQEWWWASILHRRIQSKSLPLQTVKENNSFYFILPDAIQEQLHTITQKASGSIAAQDDTLFSAEQRDRYLINSLMEESISSSLIEGAATTRTEAREMLRSGRKPVSHGERMVLNNFRAMQRLKSLKDRPLDVPLLLELHEILTEGTLEKEDQAGRFRNDTEHERVRVMDENDQVLHVPPPAHELPERIQKLCDFANGKSPEYFVHPVVRSVLVHFWLAYDHPFVDGNGRTARALFYWSMLHHGYWLFEYISLSEVLFRHAGQYRLAFLHCEIGEPDATYFLVNQMNAICEALDHLHKYIDRKSNELHVIEKRMRNASRFNHRQLALLSHALRHPHQRYSVKSHESSHNVTPQTARTDLKQLHDAGLFSQTRWGRTDYFMPVADIGKKLDSL